jgi:hypothetical protein
MTKTYLERAAEIQAALEAARKRSSPYLIGTAHLYCQNEDCIVREVTIRVKEQDGPIPHGRLTCPICRRQLELHRVTTLDEE